MKKFLAVAFTLIPTLAFAWDIKDMNDVVDQTNFLVNKGCSGTLIDKSEGFILTAAHCIDTQYDTVESEEIDKDTGKVTKIKVRVVRPGTVSQKTFSGPNQITQTDYIYKIVDSSLALDLALLKVEAKLSHTREADLACTDVVRGDEVTAVGNSYAVLYSSVTKGTVSSLQRNYRDLRIAGQLGDLTDPGEHGLVQHSAVIAPGNSGGALFNADGKLVGVNIRGAQTGFAFAVPLEDIKRFLSEKGPVVVCNKGNSNG